MCAESEEERWIDDLQPIEELRGAIRPFLVRPRFEIDPVWTNSVRVHSVGEERFEAIRMIRDVSGLSLHDAKSFVDDLPGYLKVTDIRDAYSKLTMIGTNCEKPPDKDTPRWTTYRVDRKLFDLTRLELSEHVDLWAHVHSSRSGARGMITVLPRELALPTDYVPKEKDTDRLGIANMISGDGSLESYWQASILFRELDEVGAEWHGVCWGAHSFLLQPPDESWKLSDGWLNRASLLRERYANGFQFKNLRPRLKRDSSSVVWVDFFTLDPVGTRQIMYHSDKFYERYLSNTLNVSCAKGGAGYVH